jgi:ubiquitin-protein ligase
MNPRLRRLAADHVALVEAFGGHPAITVTPVGATPPEHYWVTYAVPSLALNPSNQVIRTQQTVVGFYLPAAYPREKPYLTTTTPVFHPNFGAHVCIADHWSPSRTLVDIVTQVGDMLQWRTYNVRSPLNAVAARWVAENPHQIPVGNVDVMPLGSSQITLLDLPAS